MIYSTTFYLTYIFFMNQEITYFKLENFLCANRQGIEMIAKSASKISISEAKCSKYCSGFTRVVKKVIEHRIITDRKCAAMLLSRNSFSCFSSRSKSRIC